MISAAAALCAASQPHLAAPVVADTPVQLARQRSACSAASQGSAHQVCASRHCTRLCPSTPRRAALAEPHSCTTAPVCVCDADVDALARARHSGLSSTANNAEVSTSNLRSGAAFDNLKASWGKKLSLGDFNSQLDCSYDYNANRDFLKDVSLSGSLVDGSGDDLSVGYHLKKNFAGDKTTEVKLTAEMSGTRLCAEMDTNDQLKEVGAQRTVSIGDRDVDLEPSFLVKAQTARVKLMSAFGKDRVKAQVDYKTDDNSATYELGYQRDLEDGRQVSATLTPADKNLDVELVDSKFESGATWTAKASVPLDGDNANLLDAAKLSLKRAWAW